MQNNKKMKLVKNNKHKRINSVNLKKELKKKCIKVLLPIGIISVVATNIGLNIEKNTKSGKIEVLSSSNFEKTKQSECLELIIKYCDIYNLDSIQVYKKASELTNNFENIEINGLFYIPGTKVCNVEQKYDSLELAILCFVRHCKQKPKDFNLESEQLKEFKSNYNVDELMPTVGVTNVVNNYYNNNIELNDILPTAGVTTELNNFCDNIEIIDYEEKIDKYCSLLSKLPRELCMAIIYSECGIDENGEIVAHNNNPGNLRENNEFRKFETVEQGIIELALTLEYNFLKDIDIENTPINTIVEKIQVRYAPDSDTAYGVNKNWSNNVIKICNELKEDYYSRLDKRMQVNKKI